MHAAKDINSPPLPPCRLFAHASTRYQHCSAFQWRRDRAPVRDSHNLLGATSGKDEWRRIGVKSLLNAFSVLHLSYHSIADCGKGFSCTRHPRGKHFSSPSANAAAVDTGPHPSPLSTVAAAAAAVAAAIYNRLTSPPCVGQDDARQSNFDD